MRIRDIKLGNRLLIVAVLESSLFALFIIYGLGKLKQIINYFPIYNTVAQVNEEIADALQCATEYAATHEEKYTEELSQHFERATNEVLPRIKELTSDTEERRNFYNMTLANVTEFCNHLRQKMEYSKEMHTRVLDLEAKLSDTEFRVILASVDNNLAYNVFSSIQQLIKFQTTADPKTLEQAANTFAQVRRSVERSGTQSTALFKEVESEIQLLSAVGEKMLEEQAETQQYYVQIQTGFNRIYTALDAATTRYSGGAMIFIFGILIIMVAVIFFLAWYIGHQMSIIFNTIVGTLESLRNGDLTKNSTIRPSDLERKDEAGSMVRAIVALREKMAELIGIVAESVDGVLNAGRDMDQTARAIAQGASTQASSSEEVSSAMEEMTTNIDQNAENAQQSEKVSQDVSEALKVVLAHGTDSKNAIHEIEQKIGVVNEIASQTNILALNAAVEAARAGEHGRGFAVVASEVRKLAERSGSAANEVVNLVNSAVQASALIEKALEEVAPRVERSVQLSREVAVASVEQRNGAEQVNQSIQLLSDVSQENAVSSDRMATNAENLARLAEEVQKAVAYFHIEGKTRSVVTSKPAHSEPRTTPATKTAPVPRTNITKPVASTNTPLHTTTTNKTTVSVDKPAVKKAVQTKTTPQTAEKKSPAPSPIPIPAPKIVPEPPAREEAAQNGAAQATEQVPPTTGTNTKKTTASKPTPRPTPPSVPSTPQNGNGRKPGVQIDMTMDTPSDADYESF